MQPKLFTSRMWTMQVSAILQGTVILWREQRGLWTFPEVRSGSRWDVRIGPRRSTLHLLLINWLVSLQIWYKFLFKTCATRAEFDNQSDSTIIKTYFQNDGNCDDWMYKNTMITCHYIPWPIVIAITKIGEIALQNSCVTRQECASTRSKMIVKWWLRKS